MSGMVTTLATTTAVGVAGGLGYGAYNKQYGVGVYGSNLNDPYVGYSDYVIHGAGVGAAAGLATIGLRYQAQQKRISGVNEQTEALYRMLGGT